MRRFVLRRLLLAVPLLLGVATLLFVLVEAAPGDPSEIWLDPGMTSEVREQIRANLGLDQPAPVRYVRWIGSAARGDFGFSHSRGQPVRTVLAEILPNTLLLSGTALAVAFLLGVGIGVVQAARQNTLVDQGLSLVVLVFYSIPAFWLGIMMVLVFALGASRWNWPIQFPPSGAVGVDHDLLSFPGKVLDRLQHLVLPAATLVLVMAAGIARYARTGMLEVLRSDYVRSARARGLPGRRVLLHHALPNSLLPLITVLGLYLPVLFSGAVFVETVFAWPGMGRAMVDAVGTRDYPLILAGSLLFAVLVVLGNLVADALYVLADPRVRHE
ncbi:MAG TPA: ABC transporter permease [Longimicrobiales bacterium]|nr:ABC transporter permease [Longimicrobiales bacterium]